MIEQVTNNHSHAISINLIALYSYCMSTVVTFVSIFQEFWHLSFLNYERATYNQFIYFWVSLKCILLFFLRLSPTASTRRVCAGTYGSRAAVREGPAAPLPTRRRSWRSENTHSFPFTHIHTIMMTISRQSRAVMHKRASPHLPTSPVSYSYSSSPTRSLQHNSTLYRALAWLWQDPPSPHFLPSSLTLSPHLSVSLRHRMRNRKASGVARPFPSVPVVMLKTGPKGAVPGSEVKNHEKDAPEDASPTQLIPRGGDHQEDKTLPSSVNGLPAASLEQ